MTLENIRKPYVVRDRGNGLSNLAYNEGAIQLYDSSGFVGGYAADKLAEAVTAAGALATAANPVVVQVAAGVTRTYTAQPNVSVVFADESPGTWQMGVERLRDVPFEYTPIPGTDVDLVAIRIDDAATAWVTTDATGTLQINGVNVSPLAYACAKGIPLSFAVIPAFVELNGATYMTKTNLKDAYWFGMELAAHTYDHEPGSQPTTTAQAYKQVVECRDYLEGIDAGLATWLGAPVRGWIRSGWWNNMTTRAGCAAEIPRLIRANYEWSMGAYGYPAPGPGARHYSAYGFTKDHKTMFDVGRPGTDVVLLLHTIAASGAEVTFVQFKNIIDKLVALRTAGKVLPVSLTTFFSAIRENRGWHGVLYGDMDGVASGNLPTSGLLAGSVVGESVVTDDPLEVKPKCLKLTRTTGGPTTTFSSIRCIPGRTHCLRIAASGSLTQSVAALLRYDDARGSTNQFKAIYSDSGSQCIFGSAAWVTHYRTFSVPLWMKPTGLVLQTKVTDAEAAIYVADIAIEVI